MNNYKKTDVIIDELKKSGASKPDIVVGSAEACLEWPYVWGAVGGRICTVQNRKLYMNSKNIGQADANAIKKNCPILSGTQSYCTGCKYFPDTIGTRIFDCQGFIKWIFSQIGITFQGGGCTSMWSTAANWAEKGVISTMPKNKVCCVFRDVNGVKEHILLYDGKGNYIHCSGEVKKQVVGSYKATHWAIPKGLYDSTPIPEPTPEPSHKTIKRGSKGDDVKYAQQKLISLGYDLGSYGADGSFGAKTEAAVKAFQKSKGLTADGIVGPSTWAALEAAKPDEKPVEELYTVSIPHLSKADADALHAKYSGSTVIKE